MENKIKISIITPSYNQGQYLEETICSVINQHYPNLEYIIIDGGSTDQSVEIIKKYENQIYYWISEKDRGQSHAINKGFAQATGEIVCWLNSDDLLAPGTLDLVAQTFEQTKCKWLTANCNIIDSQSNILGSYQYEIPKNTYEWLNHFVRGLSYPILQPSTFWRKELFQKVGFLNETFHYAFDHEFFFRLFLEIGKPATLNINLSSFRLHNESKTIVNSLNFRKENRCIGRKYLFKQQLVNTLKLWLVYLKYINKP